MKRIYIFVCLLFSLSAHAFSPDRVHNLSTGGDPYNGYDSYANFIETCSKASGSQYLVNDRWDGSNTAEQELLNISNQHGYTHYTKCFRYNSWDERELALVNKSNPPTIETATSVFECQVAGGNYYNSDCHSVPAYTHTDLYLNTYTVYVFDNEQNARDFCAGGFNRSTNEFNLTTLDPVYDKQLRCKASAGLNSYKYVAYPSVPIVSLTPEQQCIDDSKYWYNNTCNDSPEPTPEEQCIASMGAEYWYNDTCNVLTFEAYECSEVQNNYYVNGVCVGEITECYALENSGPLIFSNALGSPADEVYCKDSNSTPAISCTVIQVTSTYVEVDGYWAAQYSPNGRACKPENGSEPLAATNDPVAPDTSSLSILDCSSQNFMVDLDTAAPSQLSSGFCDFNLESTVETNSLNGCSRYNYVGIDGTLGTTGPFASDLAECNLYQALTCQSPQYVSDDGLSCLDPAYPEGLGFSVSSDPYDGNPYAVFTINTASHDVINSIDSEGKVTTAKEYPVIDQSESLTMPALISKVADQVDDYEFSPSGYIKNTLNYNVQTEFNSPPLTSTTTLTFDGIKVSHTSSKIKATLNYKTSTIDDRYYTESSYAYSLEEAIGACQLKNNRECVCKPEAGQGNYGCYFGIVNTFEDVGSIQLAEYSITSSGFDYGDGVVTDSGDSSTVGGLTKTELQDTLSTHSPDPGKWGDDQLGAYEHGLIPPTFSESASHLSETVGNTLTLHMEVADAECQDVSTEIEMFGEVFPVDLDFCSFLLDPDVKYWFEIGMKIFYIFVAILLVFSI